MGAVVRGTGAYLPAAVRTNAEVAERLGTTEDWIVERTGIRQRHVAAAHEQTSDLAYEAGQPARGEAGRGGADRARGVGGTNTPPPPMPSVAALTARRLGATCAAVDVGAACAGFVYGLGMACGLLSGGAVRRVLLVGAELLSRWVDPEDRATAALFGDGAGAVVLTADATTDAGRGVCAVRLGGDPAHADALTLEDGLIRMHGPRVFKQAVRHVSDVSLAACAAAGWRVEDVDWIVPHQANARVIAAIGKRLGVPAERLLVNIGRSGNTSAASIPVALDEAARDGRLVRGQRLVLTGLGAGFVWGAVALRW